MAQWLAGVTAGVPRWQLALLACACLAYGAFSCRGWVAEWQVQREATAKAERDGIMQMVRNLHTTALQVLADAATVPGSLL
jgi:hypothetical protein